MINTMPPAALVRMKKQDSMETPPRQTHFGDIIAWASLDSTVSPTGKTRHIVNGELMKPPKGLLIVRSIERDQISYFLLYCKEKWQDVADTWYQSVEGAMKQAEFEFTGVSRLWQFFDRELDRKIERDIVAGRFDALVNEAIDDLRNGRCKEL
ncbi:MAG TPA: hypothetical protein VG711_11740 [Phycisphaerales bacterium]|nr:hypothetical protein [Phycisphaerales bacterium]